MVRKYLRLPIEDHAPCSPEFIDGNGGLYGMGEGSAFGDGEKTGTGTIRGSSHSYGRGDGNGEVDGSMLGNENED